MNGNRDKIEGIVRDSIEFLGETDWYSRLHKKRFADILEIIEKYKGDKKIKILEIGTWPGYLAVCFYYLGSDVAGIDLNPERLNKFQELGIEIITHDLNGTRKLPYIESSFNIISASEMLEHIEEGAIVGFLSEAKRILKPGGIILITTPNKYSFGSLVRFWRYKTEICGTQGHGHVKEYSKKELEKIIRANRLRIINSKRHNFYLNVGKTSNNRYFYPLSKLLRNDNKLFNLAKIITVPIRMIPLFRDSIIVIAKNEK